MWRRWLAGVAVLMLVGACGASPDDSTGPKPHPTTGGAEPADPEPTREPGVPADADPDAFKEFFAECEERVFGWREGNVTFPSTMTSGLNQATAYSVAVDLRDEPADAQGLIPSDDPAVENISVTCRVGARLSAVGSDVTVESAERTHDGFHYREITPTGVIRWNWSITPTAPRDQQLELTLRPVVLAGDDIVDSPAQQATFVTDVDVSATVIERVEYWTRTQLPLIVVAVVASAGAFWAMVAALRWRRRPKPDTAD